MSRGATSVPGVALPPLVLPLGSAALSVVDERPNATNNPPVMSDAITALTRPTSNAVRVDVPRADGPPSPFGARLWPPGSGGTTPAVANPEGAPPAAPKVAPNCWGSYCG